MLPKTFFAELAERGPIVIFNNQLYQISENSTGKDYILIGSEKLGLVSADTILNLENFYRYLHSKEISDFKKTHIESNLKTKVDEAKKAANKLSDNKVLAFMVNEIFPLFDEREEEMDAFLKGKEVIETAITDTTDTLEKAFANAKKKFQDVAGKRSRAKPITIKQKVQDIQEEQEVEELLNHFYKDEKPVPEIVEKNSDTLLTAALNNENIVTFNDVVYKLAKRKSHGLALVLNEIEYSLVKSNTTARIERSYLSELEKQLKKEAEEEFDYEKEISEVLKNINKDLKKLVDKNEYGQGAIGFIKKEGVIMNCKYFATLRVASYILQDTKQNPDIYYKFEECRVAVPIWIKEDGTVNFINQVLVVEHYEHPFLSGSDKWQNLCLGNTDMKRIYQSKNTAVQIATMLAAGKEVLQSGYTVDCKPYRMLGYNNFRIEEFTNHKISLDEVKRLNLPITNADEKPKRIKGK